MATYDVTGRISHDGKIYEVGDSFDSDDQKVIRALKDAGALGKKLADVTVEAEDKDAKKDAGSKTTTQSK